MCVADLPGVCESVWCQEGQPCCKLRVGTLHCSVLVSQGTLAHAYFVFIPSTLVSGLVGGV